MAATRRLVKGGGAQLRPRRDRGASAHGFAERRPEQPHVPGGGKMIGHTKWKTAAAVLGVLVLVALATGVAGTVDPSRLVNAEKDPNSWLSYNGTYQAWRYSSLGQINRSNVGNLKVAWIFQPGMPATEHGLEGTPLAVDGVVYVSGSYSRVWALDGATGKVLWFNYPKIDMQLKARQTHVPYNRGLAVGHGHVYVGTIDGRLLALDLRTGKQVWESQLVDSKKETVGFTGAPLVVKDLILIGSQAGEWPTRGRIFAVDSKTGKERWKFWTVGGPEDPKAQATWGGDSWKTGGGGGWTTGSYDPDLNLVYWGTGNPSPLYDWAGGDWMTKGPRPGVNLYITSIVALDADTGKLNWYFQELPHDPWDFDSSVGEMLLLERDGKKLLVHANKGGPVFVLDRTNGKVQNAYMGNRVFNFVTGVDPKTWKDASTRTTPRPVRISGASTTDPGTAAGSSATPSAESSTSPSRPGPGPWSPTPMRASTRSGSGITRTAQRWSSSRCPDRV